MEKVKRKQTLGEGMIEIIRYLSYQPFKDFSKKLTALAKVDAKDKVAEVLKSLGYHIDHSCDENKALSQNLMELRISEKMRKRWAKWIDTGRWW